MFGSFAESFCLVEIIPCDMGNIKSNASRFCCADSVCTDSCLCHTGLEGIAQQGHRKTNFGDADQAMPVIKQIAFKNANKYYKEEELLFKSFAHLQGWLQAAGLVNC